MSKSYSFTIPIGDWSGDGHSECKYFQFTSNKPLNEVREAYFKALKAHEDLSPEEFANEYQDGSVPDVVVEAAEKLGFKIHPDDFWVAEMADYVAWFITLGDPEIKLKREKDLEMLPFYGYDEKQRHISFIGYGMFSH